MIIISVIKLIGILILLISIVNLIGIKKSSEKLTDEEFYSKDNIIKRRNKLILGAVGISITSIMQLISIFI